MVHVEYDDFGEYIEINDEKTGEFYVEDEKAGKAA
jgi:hypothetical protein